MRRSLLVLLLLLSPVSYAELLVSNARIKHLPPAVPVRAGYMELTNTGSTAMSLRAVRSTGFAHVEIHRTVEKDGMMSMEPVDRVTIEANSSVQLAPGGLHLMLMQPVTPTKPGDVVKVTLVFDDGSETSLDMQVKK